VSNTNALQLQQFLFEEARPPAVMWPPVFITGQVDAETLSSVEAGSPEAKIKACADALLAWGLCSSNNPPEKFGFGMIALAEWAGLSEEDLLAKNAYAVASAVIAARDAKKTNQQP
jgi:hypothetical protein